MSAAAVTVAEQSAEQSSASSSGAAPAAAKSTKAKAGAIKKVGMLFACRCLALSLPHTLDNCLHPLPSENMLIALEASKVKLPNGFPWQECGGISQEMPVHSKCRSSFGRKMVHFKSDCDDAVEDNEDGGAGEGNASKLRRQSGSLCWAGQGSGRRQLQDACWSVPALWDNGCRHQGARTIVNSDTISSVLQQ